MTAATVMAAPVVDRDEDITAGLWAAIEQRFLDVLGWDPDVRVLTFPREHPLLGWKVCEVSGCTKVVQNGGGLCANCRRKWMKARQPALSTFTAIDKAYERCVGIGRCAVPDCGRPWRTGGVPLCNSHHSQRERLLPLPVEEFVLRPDVVPLPPLGPCAVAACAWDRPSRRSPYCHIHTRRWKTEHSRDPDLDEQIWRRTASAVAEDNKVSLRGLAPRVQAEVIYGLQMRTAQGIKTRHNHLRPFCDFARRLQVAAVEDIDVARLGQMKAGLRSSMVKAAGRLFLSPELERHKDEWNCSAFGHAGTLRFSDISQTWLREAAKRWAFDDLPQRRGVGANSAVQSKISALAQLSDSLRLQRDDGGADLGVLGRLDITAFCNRLAYLHDQGAISAKKRIDCCYHVRSTLTAMRAMGLTRPGQPLHRLADDFALSTAEIPDPPEDSGAGKDLPIEVMRHLSQNLPLLDTMGCREVRVTVELLIDTGRRPAEICQLGWDCLDRDTDGKPVLVYNNYKNHRNGRRLPIAEATAALIIEQQNRVRTRFPFTPISELRLLPTPIGNPGGRKPITDGHVSTQHRLWAAGLPPVLVASTVHENGRAVTKMLPFDRTRIFLYAYRHTYAQRHADAGVDVDGAAGADGPSTSPRLRPTTAWGRNTGARPSTGSPRCSSTGTATGSGGRPGRCWPPSTSGGQSARSPFPTGAAPSRPTSPPTVRNARCGSAASAAATSPPTSPTCPTSNAISRTCCGTGRSCGRVVDADEWARAEAMPSDQEITRIRRLIDRMKGDLDELSDEDRAQIEDAVAMVRRGRGKIIGLGMPRIRQPLPDLDRSAPHDQRATR